MKILAIDIGTAHIKSVIVEARFKGFGFKGFDISLHDITSVPDAWDPSVPSERLLSPGQIAVLGEMSELGSFSVEEHDRIGRMIVRFNIHKLVGVGEGARAIHLAAEHEGSWGGEAIFVDTADEAFDLIAADTRADDLILVKSSNSAGLRFLGDRIAEANSIAQPDPTEGAAS